MFNWVYRKSDGVFLFGGPYDPTFNDAEQGCVKLARHPDLRTERFNGIDGIRQATSEEVTTYDTAQKDAEAVRQFDNAKLLKAVVIWMAQRLGVPLVTARAEIIAIYKGLP